MKIIFARDGSKAQVKITVGIAFGSETTFIFEFGCERGWASALLTKTFVDQFTDAMSALVRASYDAGWKDKASHHAKKYDSEPYFRRFI